MKVVDVRSMSYSRLDLPFTSPSRTRVSEVRRLDATLTSMRDLLLFFRAWPEALFVPSSLGWDCAQRTMFHTPHVQSHSNMTPRPSLRSRTSSLSVVSPFVEYTLPFCPERTISASFHKKTIPNRPAAHLPRDDCCQAHSLIGQRRRRTSSVDDNMVESLKR